MPQIVRLSCDHDPNKKPCVLLMANLEFAFQMNAFMQHASPEVLRLALRHSGISPSDLKTTLDIIKENKSGEEIRKTVKFWHHRSHESTELCSMSTQDAIENAKHLFFVSDCISENKASYASCCPECGVFITITTQKISASSEASDHHHHTFEICCPEKANISSSDWHPNHINTTLTIRNDRIEYPMARALLTYNSTDNINLNL